MHNARIANLWGRRLFKAGATMLLIVGAVHSLSLFSSPVPKNETERQLLDLATNYKFDLMGSYRSLWSLMRGFSICFTLAAFGLGAFDFAVCEEPPALLKRLALINVVWLGCMTAVSLRYFFIIPTSLLIFGLLVFILSWLQLLRPPSN